MERAEVVGALKKVAGGNWTDSHDAHGARKPTLSTVDADDLALSMLAPHPASRPRMLDIERMAIAHAA